MQYKLTIDINLVHEAESIPAMDTLKRWKAEGKVELIEAEPPRVERDAAQVRPGASTASNDARDPRQRGGRRIIKRDPSHGANFRGIAAVLFPHKDPQKLSMLEINDVAHMVKHHSSKNELFVTHNLKDLIEEGKRERLKSGFGIIAMTPEEAVEMLSKIEGWK